MHHHTSKLLRHALAGAILAAACTLPSSPADAHFVLKEPASWSSQDSLGSPQKLGPCGDESGGSPTGTVTAFQQGQTITVTINETIFHPGHYRIALAVKDRSELPAEPTVTADSNSPCGSVPIQDPPVFPVLADGVFPHTSALSGPQTVQVTLPPDVTCDKCTLQIIEFMSNHPLNNPGGCFYHHCADISVTKVPVDGGNGGTTSTTTTASTTTGGTTSSAGGNGGGGGGGGGDTSKGSGCSVGSGSAPAFAGMASLLALATLLRRRRR